MYMHKLSYTQDYTHCYLDVFDLSKLRINYTGPKIPMKILIGGNGSFTSPYNINPEDPLMNSIVHLFR